MNSLPVPSQFNRVTGICSTGRRYIDLCGKFKMRAYLDNGVKTAADWAKKQYKATPNSSVFAQYSPTGAEFRNMLKKHWFNIVS